MDDMRWSLFLLHLNREGIDALLEFIYAEISGEIVENFGVTIFSKKWSPCTELLFSLQKGARLFPNKTSSVTRHHLKAYSRYEIATFSFDLQSVSISTVSENLFVPFLVRS